MSRSPLASNPDLGPVLRPRLLVADDDAPTREVLYELLSASGYDVELVADGHAAVERVGRGGIDAVLLDVVMPKMSGLEACRLMKAMTRDAFVAVILVAAKTDASSRVEGLAAGADDVVGKPLERIDVVDKLRGMLKIKRAHDQMRAARAQLEKVSVRDDLTGLSNYRTLFARLRDSFFAAERHHDPLACALFDVDRLRVHNERLGRSGGDGILRTVAQVLKDAIREKDVAARYGPDELLLLLPATHFMGAVQVTERIWRGAREASGASISVGVALYPSRDVRAREDLVRCAELALGRAKRDGMNRICVFQQHDLVYTPHAAESEAPPASRRMTPPPSTRGRAPSIPDLGRDAAPPSARPRPAAAAAETPPPGVPPRAKERL
jgi:diguanylate cyclase (GGDEF)-like protein